jgi:hypothetical protein
MLLTHVPEHSEIRREFKTCSSFTNGKWEGGRDARTAGVNDLYNDAGSGVDAGPIASQLVAECILWHEDVQVLQASTAM